MFSLAGGTVVAGVAIWDGTSWKPMGSELLPGGVFALTKWDPDGDGSQPTQLIAGGGFTASAGSGRPSSIAQWNGTVWEPLGAGVYSGNVYALTSFDRDGEGPMPAQLVAGGDFSKMGGANVRYVASWDGQQWRDFGTPPNDRVLDALVWDPDGPGPAAAELVIGGYFTSAGGKGAPGAARWDPVTNSWRALSEWKLTGSIEAAANFDPDGAGPEPELMVWGGAGVATIGQSGNNIATWKGAGAEAWGGLGAVESGDVRAMLNWDPDADGPLGPDLVVAGNFTKIGGVSALGIARWNGATWQPFGTGLGGSVNALTTWDTDVGGPLPPRLIAGGTLTGGGVQIWDGAAWQPISALSPQNVSAMTSWDPDGHGGKRPYLVVGGAFSSAGGVPANNIAGWNGIVWSPLGSGITGSISSMLSWDPDGDGPLPAVLVVGGTFSNAGGVPAKNIAVYDGVSWSPLGVGVSSAKFMSLWDPDGDGPVASRLVVAGSSADAGGKFLSGPVYWDGSAWKTVDGLNTPNTIGVWHPSGDLGAQRLVGTMGLSPWIGQLVSQWGGPPAALLVWQPSDASTCASGYGRFCVVGDSSERYTYRWQVESPAGSDQWVDLTDAVAGPWGAVAGSKTDMVVLSGLIPASASRYRALLTDTCTTLVSDPARLTICVADVDCSGVIDLSDFFAFFGCFDLSLSCADLDGSGTVDLNDFFAFFGGWDLGC